MKTHFLESIKMRFIFRTHMKYNYENLNKLKIELNCMIGNIHETLCVL